MAYASIEALIAAWAERRGISLGRGDRADLAERFSDVLMPYKTAYESYQAYIVTMEHTRLYLQTHQP